MNHAHGKTLSEDAWSRARIVFRGERRSFDRGEAHTIYDVAMTMREVRILAKQASDLSSGVHARANGHGELAELAQAIHAVARAVDKLAKEVERVTRNA
jgi:hypothetical protein